MEASVAIDPKSGSVSLAGLCITPQLRLSDLSQAFSLGPELPVVVLGKAVPCQFAAAYGVSGGRRIKVDLRFEKGLLVSCFFTFPGVSALDAQRICSEWL